ncbi:hypothetical protein [Glaciecola sp. SC05]|uniref:hypothetical protein n=1 Tax=Glaciecola sp. SC05 TaxID=1987355 RepID=UPI0035291597
MNLHAKFSVLKLPHALPFTVIALLMSYSTFSQTQSSQEFPVSAYECTQVSLDEIDESLLTREERIARLDMTLSDSIDSYTSCVNTVQNDMSGGGGGGGKGAGTGTSAGAGQQAGQANQAGQADAPEENNQASGAPQAGSASLPTENQSSSRVQRGIVAPKDNDSIICKLLFDEIQKASGTSAAGLEKQYRDYQCGN